MSEREMVQRAAKRHGKEGNRWVNEQPSGDAVATWFKENVAIAEKLEAEHYVGGVTLIPSNEKTRAVVGWDAGNSPIIKNVYDLVLTPYMRVETRVKYFHDLTAAEGWLGVIEPVAIAEQNPRLPKGFFISSTRTSENTEVRYVGCSMKVTVFKRDTVKFERRMIDKRSGHEDFVRVGELVIDAAPATKLVPVLTYGRNRTVVPDDFALMKAETGAVGRALGMAGILVIPGTGIATAEDLQEAGQLRDAVEDGASPEDAELPPERPEGPVAGLGSAELDNDEEMRAEATRLIGDLDAYPEVKSQFLNWAKERGHNRLSEVTSPALRGLLRKAESMLADARAAGDPAPTESKSSDPLVS